MISDISNGVSDDLDSSYEIAAPSALKDPSLVLRDVDGDCDPSKYSTHLKA
jgi:hypothetical protein